MLSCLARIVGFALALVALAYLGDWLFPGNPRRFFLTFTAVAVALMLLAWAAFPLLERREAARHANAAAAARLATPEPDWEAFGDYYELSRAMSGWWDSGKPTLDDMMERPMRRLLELCFEGRDNGPVRARTMEFYRGWVTGFERDNPASGADARARRQIDERLRGPDARLAWLIDVYDGKIGHHSSPGGRAASCLCGTDTLLQLSIVSTEFRASGAIGFSD